jgi:hypothetical protein
MTGSGWFQRNWKWVVPVGCLGYAILLAAAGAGMTYMIFSMFRRSEVYQRALERARDDPRVRRALGEPIEPGWWVTGNFQINGPSGNASLMIPISGPRNSAWIFAVAEKQAGIWNFEILEVEVHEGDGRIDLLVPPDILEVRNPDPPIRDGRGRRFSILAPIRPRPGSLIFPPGL